MLICVVVKEKLPLILLAAIAFTIALPIRVNALTTIVALIVGVAIALASHKDLGFYKTPFFILIFVQGLVLALGWLHSADQKQGSSDIERYLYAIALPITVYACRSRLTTVGNVVAAFAIGCGALLLYGLIYVAFVLPPALRSEAFINGHDSFTEYIAIHPTYLTIYLIFVFFFLTEYSRTHFNQLVSWKKGVIVVSILAVVAAILFLRSQIELLVFVLLLVLYVLILYKKRAAMVTFLLFAIGLVVYLSDSTRARTVIDSYGQNVSSAVDERWSVWGGALLAIADAPVFGAGTGGEQYKLNSVFTQMGYTNGATNAFNAHNQYLELAVRNGIFELLIFLALLFVLFRKALHEPNYTFLLMLMLMTMSMIAESCLNVQKGIAFFYFFASVFMFLPDTPSADKNRQ